ncbi:MAG: ankyrin repeat domain-containing protein [Gemmatimonadaceae bacterium]
MKFIFWILVAGDAAVLLLFFVLGLAAATSTRTSGFVVAAYMLVIPGIVLAASVLLFVRSTVPAGRFAGLLLAAAPLLILVYFKSKVAIDLAQNSDSSGQLTSFREGPLREIGEAINRNDTATVVSLLPKVDINAKGFQNTTLLMYALRRLRETPTELGSLRAIVKAGANPNLGAGGELPLNVALQESRNAGAEPAKLLLAAGANPNTTDPFGEPLYFSAIGGGMNDEIMQSMIEHGANLKITDKNGLSVVFHAAMTQNWPVALMLLQHGVEFRKGRNVNGLSFEQMVESDLRTYGDKPGIKEVLQYVKSHP